MSETLKNHQLLANINKCEFSQQYLMYLGYVIGGGELKIDLVKMEAIMKYTVPTNFIKVRSFVGAARYLRKFIASFSAIVAPLHAITASGNSFRLGKNQQKAFDELKGKISQAPVLALPNLQNPFEVETDASGYAMGAFFMQGGKPLCCNFDMFHGEFSNSHTYDKEIYTLFKVVKKSKNYLMGKERII